MNQLPLPSKLINEFEILASNAEIEDWEHSSWHDGRPTIQAISRKLLAYLIEVNTCEMARNEIIKYITQEHCVSCAAATAIVDEVAKTAGMIRYLDREENSEYYIIPTRYPFSLFARRQNSPEEP